MSARTPLDSLLASVGLCSPTHPCLYHAAKRTDVSLCLPVAVTNAGPSKGVVRSSARMAKAVDLTEAPVGQPAGSWNLLPEEKSWFVDRISATTVRVTEPINIAVFGIAGLPHFLDTYRLIRKGIGPSSPLRISVIDRCLTPLSDIADHCRHAGIAVVLRDGLLPAPAAKRSGTEDVTVELIKSDIVDLPRGVRNFHVVIMHYLLRFMTEGPAGRCLRFAQTLLEPVNGALIAAQDKTPFMSTSPDEYFAQYGFRLVGSKRVWAPYKLSATQRNSVRCGLPIEVDLDCWLLHMKVSPGNTNRPLPSPDRP